MSARDEMMFWAMMNNPSLYEKFLEEEYVRTHGQHFDEDRAKRTVADMHSKYGNGELWKMDQIDDYVKLYRSELQQSVTDWDLYVAINLWQHQLGENYVDRLEGDDDIIKDAITFFFLDETSGDGKIWRYTHSV